MEKFAEIKGFKGLYQIGCFGSIKSLERIVKVTDRGNRRISEKVLRVCPNTNGYLTAVLCKGGIKKTHCIHQLVGNCFVSGRKKGLQLNHKDGDKNNNHFSNLEWVTASENTLHSYQIGLKKRPFGEANPMVRLSDKEVAKIRKKYSKGHSISELCDQFGITSKWCKKIIRNKVRI